MTESTCLIQTRSCYAGAFDKSSPAYFKGLMRQELDGASADVADTQPGFAIFALNSRLIDRSEKGQLLVWTLLFDGVYKARIQVGPDLAKPERLEPADHIGRPADLLCPTGEIVVVCLDSAGDQSIQPIMRVEPGTYRATIEQHECESDHIFLENISDYPLEDGPDWTITLARLRF